MLDVMMVVAFANLSPGHFGQWAPLMPAQNGAAPITIGVLSEILMLDYAQEIDVQYWVSPISPLITEGWLRASGGEAGRILQMGIRFERYLLEDEGRLNPPEGARLITRNRLAALTSFYAAPALRARLDEVKSLITLALDPGTAPLFDDGGPSFLFVGGPGTGKSLAVKHLAQALERPLYHIDLGQIVSKWVGETESNFNALFAYLSGTGAILQIDGADAIVGKRTLVKDGRDHYTNMTISHLLGLVERHQGPIVFTTNMAANIDAAFLRRMQAILRFSRPGRPSRTEMWAALLGELVPELPPEPMGEWAAMLGVVDMSHAEIKGAMRKALALAHMKSAPLGLGHLARAIWLDRTKANGTFSRQSLGALAAHPRSEVEDAN